MKTERGTAAISELRAAPYNPRRISKEAMRGLRASLGRWGVVQEIVVNRRTGHIVGGHQRVEALKLEKAKEAPVCWVDLDEVEEKALNVALNNPHISGEFDESLASLLVDIGAGIGAPAMTELRLDELLGDGVTKDGLTDADDAPEPPPEPTAKLGDVWLLGEHRLMCGDSTDIAAVERLMAGARADCVWTDPPYGVAVNAVQSIEEAKKRRKRTDGLVIQNDDLNDDELTDFLRASLGAAFAVSREGAAWYVAAPAGPLFHCFGTVLKELDIWRHTLAWVKSTFVLGRSDYHYQHEAIFYGWKPGAAHAWMSDRKQSSTLHFDKPSRSVEHPTMKPVALVEYCLGNSSKAGDVVYEPFGGSGTTLIACERLGRIARVMELDPRYVDVIIKRWQDFTGKTATLEARDA